MSLRPHRPDPSTRDRSPLPRAAGRRSALRLAVRVDQPIEYNVHVDAEDVLRQLLGRARWSASRSSGPGGQHRDKASTRAELTLDLEALDGLETDLAERLARGLGLTERPLRIQVQDERSLTRNQEIAAQRLAELVANALAPPPAERRATRPTRAARQARLDQKARRAGVKRTRRPEPHHDEA